MVGGALLLFLLVNFFIFLQPADKSDSDKIIFNLKKGDSFETVVRGLEEQGLIKSRYWFKIYSLVTGSAHLFKPGLYELNASMSGLEIARIIVSGPSDIKLTVKEGATLADIDRQLADVKVIELGDLLKFNQEQEQSLEGFLFPDTYHFAQYSLVEDVVRRFTANFQDKVGNYIKADNYSDLIIASLIEKEAIYPQDRLLVSGILQKRLAIKMPLQIDASVVYAKCNGAFLTCGRETRDLGSKDLKIESLYNTYLHLGLPPTPISNPGKEAIIAATNPQKSKYLFYISNPKTGRIVFAQTLDEHNQNRFKYLR